MLLTIFAVGYVLLTLFAALIFYCACVIGSEADDRAEVEEARHEAAFVFDPAQLVEKPIG